MAKVLKMPNRERRANPSDSTDLPELLESAKDEESATVATINKWLDLGDHALSNPAPVAEVQRYK